MAKGFDPMNYAKNVVKSAGYITAETIKGVNPTLTSYITDGKNSAKEMYSNIRNYKTTIKTAVNNVLGDTGFDDLKRIKTNAFEDLRTGKFYNAERSDKFMEDFARANGISFDFDDEDLNITDEEVEGSSGPSNAAIGSLADQLYKGQKESSNASASRIIGGNRKNTAAQIAHSEKMFNQVNISLAALNSSILSLHQDLAKPVNTHIINSMNFYQTATTELAKQTSLLENMNKMLTERFAPPKGYGAGNTKRTAWEEVMGYGGIPSMRNWARIAKQNAISNIGLDAFADVLSPDMIQLMMQMGGASPISFLLTQLLSSKIANGSVGRSLNRTMNTLRGGMTHTAIRVSKYAKDHKNENTLRAILARAFDIMPSGKAKMDFSKYNQGRAEWTGRDSKALQEVIPTQLAEILSAITGKDAKIFDYKTGKFMTTRKVREQFQKDRASAIGSATGAFRSEVIDEFIAQDREENPNAPELNSSSKAVRNLSKTYDSLMSLLSINGVDVSQFNTAASLVSFCRARGWVGSDRTSTGSRAYILDEVSLRRLAKVLYSRRVGGMTGRFEDAVVSGGIANRNFVANADTNSSFGNLANGSNLSAAAQNSIFAAEDKSGRNVFFYLQNYYEQLRYITEHMSAGGVTGNRKDNRNVSSGGSRNQSVTRVPAVIASDRATETRASATVSSSSGGTDYVPLSDEDRLEYNRDTESYEEPSNRSRAFSRASREKAEKDNIFSRGIDKLNSYIDKLFYGTAAGENGEVRHYGIAGLMKDLTTDISGTINRAIENTKNFFSKFWQNLKQKDGFRKYTQAMKDSVKKFAVDTWEQGKETAANVYSFFRSGKRPSWAADVANPAGSRKGGLVKKSGMVSVSEGEMIVPADQNPYYTGHMGNAARDSIENTNYTKWQKDGAPGGDFWGMFGKGTKDPSQWHKLSDKVKDSIRKMASEGWTAEEIAKKLKKPAAQVQQVINSYNRSGKANVAKEGAKEKWDKFKGSKTGKQVIGVAEDILHRLDASIEHLVGDPNKYKDAKSLGKDAINVAKNNLPKTLAGGTLGALVGAATTGTGLGLLGGFVIGAGTSIINNSDAISRKLFGLQDSKGDYRGGVFGKKASNFIKKRLPKVAKSGALGGVLGTLGLAPGGILGGLAIGAGLELVSTTDTFKNIMFGHEDARGNRRGGLMGSLKVNVVDPLIEFTKGGIQKISDYIKENFLKPVSKIFDPIKDWVKGKSRRLMDDIAARAKETVKRTIGEKFDAIFTPLTSKIGAAGKWALGAAGKVVSAPFKLVGKTGEALERHNIRRGYSSKSAADRMALEGKKMGLFGKKIKNTEYTKWAANASDEDIQSAEHYMNGRTSFKRTIIKKRQDLANLITASLVDGGAGNPKVVKDIKSLFNTDKVRKENDFSDVITAVNELDENLMGAKTKKLVLGYINRYQNEITAEKNKFETFDQDQEDFFNRIGLTDAKARKKFIKQGRIQSQFDAKGIRKATGLSQDEALRKARSKDEAAKLLKEQEEASPIDTKRNNLLMDIRELVSGIAKKNGVPATNTSTPAQLSDSGLPLLPPRNTNPGFEDNPPEAEDGAVRSGTYNGKPIQEVYRESERKWVPNLNDADTKRVVDEDEENTATRNKFYNTFIGGGLLASIKGLFNGKDNGGEKETLVDRLKNFGTNVLGFGKSLLTILGGAGGILSLLTIISSWKNGESASSGFNKIEDAIRGRDTSTYKEGDFITEYESSRYKKRVVKNIIEGFNPTLYARGAKMVDKTIGKIPVMGKMFGTPLKINVKGIANKAKSTVNTVKSSKVTQKAVDLGKTAAKKSKDVLSKLSSTSAGQATSRIFSSVKEKVGKVLEIVGKKIGGSKVGTALLGASDDIAGKIVKYIGKGAKAVSDALPIIGLVLTVADVVNAVLEGAQSAKAKTILGITDDPTLSQRILAAAINGINYAIPFVGGLIPSETLFNIVHTALKAIGLDDDGLDAQREKAKAELAEYNEANGTTYNVEEYVHNVQNDYTVQERIKKAVGGGLKKIGTGIKNTTTSIVDAPKKLVANISERLSNKKSKNGKTDYFADAARALKNMYKNMESKFNSTDTEFKDVIAVNAETSEDNPLNGIVKSLGNVYKFAIVPVLFAKGLGKKVYRSVIKPAVDWVKNGVSTAMGTITTSASTGKELMRQGDLKGLWSMNSDSENPDSPMKGLSSVADFTTKMALTVPTAFVGVGKKISGFFSNIKNGIPDISSMIPSLWSFSDPNTDMSGWSGVVDSYKKSGDTGFEKFGNGITDAVSGIMHMFVSIIRPIKSIGSLIGSWIAPVKEKVTNAISGVKDAVSGAVDKVKTFFGGIFNFGNDVLTDAKNWLATGSGVHTSQKGNNRRFGHSTIDQNGCGPAVATTVLKAYGKNVGINDAAAYAERGGYVAGASGVGTRASYFEDILGRNGINTSYTSNKSGIRNAIRSGKPTILLGQDKGNRSKVNSPFGPNPHYVVARGTDVNGNVIVDDPELNGTTVYNKSILNKTKLGVATGGASGADGLVSGAIGGIFSGAINKLGDSDAGKILKFIFGGSNDEESDETTYGDSSYSGTAASGRGVVTYGTNNLFKIATSTPTSSDPYIKLYNNSKNGGISQCVNGKPTDSTCNVLANCVGWACARFNHIYNLLTGNTGIAFPGFNVNAEKFIEVAQSYGLSVGTEPQVGAIMCWQKGATLGGIDGAGHVAIVEQVVSEDEVLTSESGYNSKQKFQNKNRKKGNGNWDQGSAYKFRGFIYNPAVTEKTAVSGGSKAYISGEGTAEDVWKFLKRKGLTDAAAAGVMGCWQAESSNKSNRVEGDYMKSYPGSSTVMASKTSLSNYTVNTLFPYYARNNLSINKDAYKGSDGSYYPGIGLAQWTGPRASKLINYAESSGTKFSDMGTQLDYFWTEFSNRKGLAKKLNEAKSAAEAATIFLDGFEMYDGWHNTKSGQKQNSERQNYAKSIMSQYQGVKASVGRGSGLTNLTGVPVGNYTAGDSQLLENVNKTRHSSSTASAKRMATQSDRKTTPVTTYDFTAEENKKTATGSGSRMRYQQYAGSASNMESYIKEINQILAYLKQLVNNTAYNASIPTIIEVMNQGIGLLSQIGNYNAGSSNKNSAAATDFATNINNSIEIMRSKMQAVAQTL